jgi:hypothetical protein
VSRIYVSIFNANMRVDEIVRDFQSGKKEPCLKGYLGRSKSKTVKGVNFMLPVFNGCGQIGQLRTVNTNHKEEDTYAK